MASLFFNSNNCSRRVIAKNCRLCMQLAASACKLLPHDRQSNATGIKSTCNWRPHGYNLHATGGHSVTICMRLGATRLQDKRQADKRCVKGRIYIIIIIFLHWQVHILDACFGLFSWRHLDIWFGKCTGTYYGWHSHTEANFARASGQLRAKPPVFCKQAEFE